MKLASTYIVYVTNNVVVRYFIIHNVDRLTVYLDALTRLVSNILFFPLFSTA